MINLLFCGNDGVFDGIFAGDMELPKVRKPELLARVMARYGARPGDCALVGDTSSDFEAASMVLLSERSRPRAARAVAAQ